MKAALPVIAALLLAGPAMAQDVRVWSLVETSDNVMLVYGTPDSDDLWAGLGCRPGTGEAVVHLTLQKQIGVEKTDNEVWMDRHGEPEPWEIKATVAGVRVEASGLADEMNGGSTLTVPAPVGGPVLAAIGKRGRLVAKALGETVDPPPFRTADFERFVAVCVGVRTIGR